MTSSPRLLALTVAACSLGLLAPLCARAAPDSTCPATFPTQVVKVSSADPTLVPGIGAVAPLTSIGLFDGPPEQGAALKPAQARDGRVTWRLDPPYPQGVWAQCSYAGGALTLARALPTTPSVCVARYGKPKAGKPQSVELDCK